LTLLGCGGGEDSTSSDNSSAGLTTVTTSYDNGQVETTGLIDAEGRRQGPWQVYFVDGKQVFTGSFVDDQLDHSKPWTEWNDDGSIRFDQSDGEHPHGGPW